MEWTQSIRMAIEFMENHLLEDIDGKDVADAVHISPFYFQKGFKIMTDYTIGEYIRNRRLYLAALDLIAKNIKIIDLAYTYGYDSPESFTKAFSRFHGVTPSQVRGDSKKIKAFLPLKISIQISGGYEMDYTIEKMNAFKVIGFSKHFDFETAYGKIPEFWSEFCQTCSTNAYTKEIQSSIERCMIGEFGICISAADDTTGFTYMIAGTYDGGTIPDGMKLYEIPALEWAKFKCIGALPGALQTINTEIFQEWLPGNKDFEIACGMNIEWYSQGDGSSQNYESGIWVPIKRKE